MYERTVTLQVSRESPAGTLELGGELEDPDFARGSFHSSFSSKSSLTLGTARPRAALELVVKQSQIMHLFYHINPGHKNTLLVPVSER